jgi:hypothetical protein
MERVLKKSLGRWGNLSLSHERLKAWQYPGHVFNL